jgi:hypothetical protein
MPSFPNGNILAVLSDSAIRVARHVPFRTYRCQVMHVELGQLASEHDYVYKFTNTVYKRTSRDRMRADY